MAKLSEPNRGLDQILSPQRKRHSRWGVAGFLAAALALLILAVSIRLVRSQGHRAKPSVKSAVARRRIPPAAYSPEYFGAVEAARNLEPSDAAGLEQRVRNRPGDFESRLQLLVIYTRHQDEDESFRARRMRHFFWLLANHPESEILSSEFAVSPSVRHDMTQTEYASAAVAWERAVDSRSRNARVAWNASQFFRQEGPEFYERYLRIAVNRAPENDAYGTELGQLYAASVVAETKARQNRLDSPPRPAPAKNALQELEATHSAAVLEGATRMFQNENNAALAARGKPEPMYAQLAQRFFDKAQALDPAIDQYWVLPQLPKELIGALGPQSGTPHRDSPPSPVLRRAAPSEFSLLPPTLQRKLHLEGCVVPQPPSTDSVRAVLKNVIHGEFQRARQTDWAVVCDFPDGTEAILVFWNGSEGNRSVVARSPVNESGCWTEIVPVGRDFIMEHYRAYGGPTPPPIDHQGIDAGLCEKASVTHYFHEGHWLRLQGAD